jgi:hypothetical protein
MSFIHPKKQAEEQEVEDWQAEFVRARDRVVEVVEAFSQAFGSMPPNEMVLDMRMKALVEFLVPAHLDRQSDPFAEDDVLPTNVDRLQYEVGWFEKLARLVTDIREQIQNQQAQAGMGPNGHNKKLIVPGVGDIKRVRRND